MRKISRKGLVRKLDAIVKQIVVARDGRCIVCGTTQNLTPGHLFSRVAYSTRWDLDNVFAQCLSCNFRHESDPYPMTIAVENKILRERGYKTADLFLEDLHYKYVHPVKFKDFQLQELLEELEAIYEKHEEKKNCI